MSHHPSFGFRLKPRLVDEKRPYELWAKKPPTITNAAKANAQVRTVS